MVMTAFKFDNSDGASLIRTRHHDIYKLGCLILKSLNVIRASSFQSFLEVN